MPRRRTTLRVAALATALATAVAGGALVAPAASAQGWTNAPDPAFYQPPAELPAGNGDLIKVEPLPLAVSVPALPGIAGSGDGPGTWPADGYRIMYRSIGSKGQPIGVTGTYLQPRAPWTGGGTRPLAVVAPGTQGQGDNCAPSKSFQTIATVQTDPPSVGIGYELLQAYALLTRGYAVVVTDYEGLGTPGLHSYVHREASARAVLDAARAASRVPASDTGPQPRTVLTGYSQGGGAVAAAAEMHPQYAPEMNLVGTSAGSPPAEALATLAHIDGTVISGAIGYALNSLADAYPELRDRLDLHLNDAGQEMLRTTANQCIAETAVQYALRPTSDFTKSGRPAADIVREDPVVARYAEMQRIGRLRPTTPVRVLSVTNDDVVPGPQSMQLGRDWCEQGAPVQMDVDHTPPIFSGFVINHGAPMVIQLGNTVQYLADRVDGRPAPSNCGTY